MNIQSKKQSNKAIIEYLVEHFPQSFSLNGECKPLKVGIFQEIVENIKDKNVEFSNTQLRSALRRYTSNWRYLNSIKKGTFRVDLTGNPCDEIQLEHQTYAQDLLKKSKELAENRKPKNSLLNKTDKNQPAKKINANLPKVEIKKPQNELVLGQKVKILVGKNQFDVMIVEITKDTIKVRLDSGMELSTRREFIVS